ncbi:hypothetical protein V8D89_014273, partial [Ganoderma adspersum]
MPRMSLIAFRRTGYIFAAKAITFPVVWGVGTAAVSVTAWWSTVRDVHHVAVQLLTNHHTAIGMQHRFGNALQVRVKPQFCKKRRYWVSHTCCHFIGSSQKPLLGTWVRSRAVGSLPCRVVRL